MSDDVCTSVGSSVDSTLFNVLAAGRDKSKKTLEEIKALQERNRTLIKNELKEYKIVNKLISEHIRFMPGLLSTPRESSQLGATLEGVDKVQDVTESMEEEEEEKEPRRMSNWDDNIGGVDNPNPHTSTHLEENAKITEKETTDEGAAAVSVPPENERDPISKHEEPPQKGDPYAGFPSRMNLLQLKQKIERQRLTLSDVKDYQTSTMLLSEVKKIRQLSFSDGAVVKISAKGSLHAEGSGTGDNNSHSKLALREEATIWHTPNEEDKNDCTKGGGIIEQLLMSSDFRSSLSSKGAQGEPLGDSFTVALDSETNGGKHSGGGPNKLNSGDDATKLSSPDCNVHAEANGVDKTKDFLYSIRSVGDLASPSSGEFDVSDGVPLGSEGSQCGEASQGREASQGKDTRQYRNARNGMRISRIDSQYFTGELIREGNSGETLLDGSWPQRGKDAEGSANHPIVIRSHSRGEKRDDELVEVVIRLSRLKIEETFKKKLQFFDKFCLSICVPISYEGQSDGMGEEQRGGSASLNDLSTCRMRSKDEQLDLSNLERIAMKGEKKDTNGKRSGNYVNHKKGRNEGKTYRQDASIKYDNFCLKSRHVNENFIEFGEDIHYKVERQLFESVEKVAILLCASECEQRGRKKKKKKKMSSSKLHTLQRKNVTIVKSLNRPFVVPDWYEILAYGEVPFICKIDVEAPLRELCLPWGSSSHLVKRPLVMVYLQLAMLYLSKGEDNYHLLRKGKTSEGRSLTEPSRRERVQPREGRSHYDEICDQIGHVVPQEQIIQSCESNRSYCSGGENTQGESAKAGYTQGESAQGGYTQGENPQGRSPQGVFTDEEQTGQVGASSQTVAHCTNRDANDVLYIYVHKMLNLSKRRFDNMSICVRFTKEEKYDYRSFTLEEEKTFDFFVHSKRRVSELREVILEVWRDSTGKDKRRRGRQGWHYDDQEESRDCVGIVNIPLEDIIQKEQVICLEKHFEMTHQFYENMNFMFWVILVRGQKNRQENVRQFCEKYIESYANEGKHSLSNRDDRTDESLTSSVFSLSGGEQSLGKRFAPSDSDPPGEEKSSMSINEQYFIYDSESLQNSEYYVYELQREVLQKDVRSSALIASVMERARKSAAGRDQTSDDEKGDDQGSDDEKGDDQGSDDERGDDQRSEDHVEDSGGSVNSINNDEDVPEERTQKRVSRRRKREKAAKRKKDPAIYLPIEFIKEELLLRGMKEDTVHLMIADMKKNTTKKDERYILKTHFEEYIDKIFTKWEKLTNKLFIRNRKKMLLNDVCEYLDNLYIDDDRYISKEEFFIFFQEVGIVFVDSTVFDELCLLFFDKERKEIYFSAFSALIIKRGVEELKNTVYGYDILLRLFGSFYENQVTIEFLENELGKMNLQTKNYYSARIKRYFSSEALRSSSIDQGTADENLGRFLKEEENVCSCTSLLFLHSVRFMLTRFNNRDFSNQDLFFLVKYLLQTQCNYSRTDGRVLVNVIKGIESLNLSFFLALYHMYVQQHASGGGLQGNAPVGRSQRSDPTETSPGDEPREVEAKRFPLCDGMEGSTDGRISNGMVVSSPRGGAQAEGGVPDQTGDTSGQEADNEADPKSERGDEGGQVALFMLKSSDKDEALLTGDPDKSSEIIEGGSPVQEENTPRGEAQTDAQNYDGAKEPWGESPTIITETQNNRSLVSGLNDRGRKDQTGDHTMARKTSNDALSNVKRQKHMSVTKTTSFCNATDERKNTSRPRKDIRNSFKYIVIILHGKIVSGLITVEYISECLFRYFGRRRGKDRNEQNDKMDLLMLFDLLGLYTSYEIALKVLNWYAREVIVNRGGDNDDGVAANGVEATVWGGNHLEERQHENTSLLQDFTAINHQHNIKKIMERHYLNEQIGGNIFSGSTLEDFFSLLKEKDIGIQAFSKKNIFTYSDFYATVENLNLDFSRNYLRLLFSNLLTYDLTSFTSVNNKLIFYDCMEAYWLNWNRAHFEFHRGEAHAKVHTEVLAEVQAEQGAEYHARALLDSVKQRRKELAIFKKTNQVETPNRVSHIPQRSRLVIVREEWATSIENTVSDPTSLFFYLSENGTLRGEELIKHYFFMNMFRCEMNSVNVDDYANDTYTFYDFWQICKDKCVSQCERIDDDSFREDLLRLIVVINGDHRSGKEAIRKGHSEGVNPSGGGMRPSGGPTITKSASSLQTLLKGKTHLFSKNFKKNLANLRLAVENLGKGMTEVSHSPLGPCLGRSRSAITQSAVSFNANWNRSGSYDAGLGRRTGSTESGETPLVQFLKRNKHVVGHIREFFYLFVFCCKVANNESVDLSFHEQEWIFYRGKLKDQYSQRGERSAPGCTPPKGENKHTYVPPNGAKKREKDRPNHSPFLYKEVRICCEEKKFTSQEYKGVVYPYLLLLCDLLKKIVHIYKDGHAAYLTKRFSVNYEEKNSRITFLHRVENIMTRSGSFDSKEWNKMYSIFEALDIRISEFLLNLWSCLEVNNYIMRLPNGVTLFNDCYNTVWDLMRPKGSGRSSLWADLPTGRKRDCPRKSPIPLGRNRTDRDSDEWNELYVKNVKYVIAFNKLLLSDVRGINRRSLLHNKYITQDRIFTTHMTNVYVRALFNECILTGLNINRLFAHIDKKDSFIYVLSKNFNHIFSEEDMALFVKKYSFVVDMTSLHLRNSCHNFFSTKSFLNDLYRQGEYYNAELKGKLFRFFFKNENVFFCKHHQRIVHTNFEPMDKHHLMSCDKLKNILSLHGLFLSWAELYDFFQPLNKFCVIYDSKKFELHEAGKPGPYILKAYINLPNLLRLARRAARKEVERHGGGEEYPFEDNRNREKDVEKSVSRNNFHKKDSYTEKMPTSDHQLSSCPIRRRVHSGTAPSKKEPLRKAIPRKENAKEEEQKKKIHHGSHQAVYTNLAKIKALPRTYFYHFRFNSLTMGRILFFFFIKLANLKSKSNLTHEQMYYGIKRAGKKDIVKKEMKNACHLLLNMEENKLDSIIPDDFVLKKEEFLNGVHLNLFLLRDRLDFLFGENHSSPIHVHQFVHFFDTEKGAVSFSNYRFVYNFSYEWVNRMHMKDEYVTRESCEAFLAEFRLPGVEDDSNGEGEPPLRVAEVHEASDKESNVKKKKENFQNGVEDVARNEKPVWRSHPEGDVTPREATPRDTLEDNREDPPVRHSLWKDQLVKMFKKNIKGKWKKILMPIFHRKEFYAHRFRIIIKEFTGMKNFVRKMESEKWRGREPNVDNKSIHQNGPSEPSQPSAPISLSYFCCFAMKEIVMDNICTESAMSLGGETRRGGDSLHVNYLFEHTFSTVREKDIITLFEHNKKIFKLKLLRGGSIIAEADLHILEMFSIMRNEEKKSQKILCFIPTDADNKNIIFLDVDMYYKRTKMGSGDPIFETSHRMVSPNFCVEQLAEESPHQRPHQVDLAKLNSSIMRASEKRDSNNKELIKRTQSGVSNNWCSDQSAHRTAHCTHGEDNSTSMHRRTNCTLTDSRQRRDGLTASPVVHPRITNGTTQMSRQCSGEYVWLRNGREVLLADQGGGNVTRGGYGDEAGDADETNYAAPNSIILVDGILEGHACRENPNQKHSSRDEYQIKDKDRRVNRWKNNTSHVYLTVNWVILPACLIRKMISRLSGNGNADRWGDDVFVAVYVEVYQRMDTSGGSGSTGSSSRGNNGDGTYELLSRSIPQMVSWEKRGTSPKGSDESLESWCEEEGGGDDEDDADNGTMRRRSNRANGTSPDGDKAEGGTGTLHNVAVNPGEQTHPSREESQSASMQLLKEEEAKEKKKKERKRKIKRNHSSAKLSSIHNLKIKHREFINSGSSPYVEGKITVKALISLNHISEDVAIGEHFFKIKNILHENADAVFCWESLFHGVYGENAFSEEEKERNMILDSSDVRMGSTDRVLMRNETEMVTYPKEEAEKLAIVPHLDDGKGEKETILGNKSSIEREKKENSIVLLDNGNAENGRDERELRKKRLIGYVSFEYEIKRTEDERNYEKRDHFAIPNFVKIYFLKKNRNNENILKGKNDILRKTTLEKLFGEVLRRVNYKKYVKVETLLDALSYSVYSNYMDYIIRLFRHYVGADTSLFFPVENILLILALRKLSSHFSNVMIHLFREFHPCNGEVNSFGVVEWSHFVKCMLKAQCGSSNGGGVTVGRGTRSVKRERLLNREKLLTREGLVGAANQGPPQELYHKLNKRGGKKTNMFSSTSSCVSSFSPFSAFTQEDTEDDDTSSTASSSAERHREGETPLRGKHRMKALNPLSQRDWCLLNHWEKWHLHQNDRSCFFLLLFLNDMIIFYRENKRAVKSHKLNISLPHTCSRAQVKNKECPLHRKHYLSGLASGLTSRCGVRGAIRGERRGELKHGLSNRVLCGQVGRSPCGGSADQDCSQNRSRHWGPHKGDAKCEQRKGQLHPLKTCRHVENDIESLPHYGHRRRATLSKHHSRDASPEERYRRSTSAADLLPREQKGKKRTSIYHYNLLRDESKVAPVKDPTDEECTNGVNSFTVLGRNLRRDHRSNQLYSLQRRNEDVVMEMDRTNLGKAYPSPYRLYVKVKRLFNAATLVKERMAMSFQVVLSNYDWIQSGHMLPYFVSPEHGYIINKIQAVSRPFLNDPHSGINTAVVLALPTRAEMSRVSNATSAEKTDNTVNTANLPGFVLKANTKGESSYGLLKMCLKNLSLQICFYDVPFWSDSLSEESYANDEALGCSLYPAGQQEGRTRQTWQTRKTLVSSTFIPLTVLLKKHKTKVRAPLVSSPFCSSRGRRSDMEVEILLKYDRVDTSGVQQKRATQRGGQNDIQKIVQKNAQKKEHNFVQKIMQTKFTQVRPTQEQSKLLKSRLETWAYGHANGKESTPEYGIVAEGLNIDSSAETQSRLLLSDDFDLAGRHDSIDFCNIPLLTLPKIPPPIS
ncbi:hypothetical protein C922_01190 [Plasmodium inui San Antonio 1]|uniref:EF-hand domain-containing protein n=1 Tax=Plasmodium inui San Antonio 1 TaxID=1237626 RepID=W7A501_9APIC|nr:hypothetical protein C922_01190 [Plasmodium inui San Antonio 1]EUD68172.1 hypothetical protein C922_01190 [Plasmodium inui San Antonio 1]